MDSSVESEVWRPCIHHHGHHHHFHVSPHCPLHSYLLHFNPHSPPCPLFNLHSLSQNPQPDAQNLRSSDTEDPVPVSLMMHEENEELEQEEDEDPVFVLTDEWREFFAKSEARRRLEKKQAKEKGKK